MAQLTNWHGIARCLVCEWKFDVAGDTTAIDMDKQAASHERKTKHAVSTSLHRMDYCDELGCTKREEGTS